MESVIISFGKYMIRIVRGGWIVSFGLIRLKPLLMMGR